MNQYHPAAHAARIINQTNRHIFLTGKAGTGKTTFLKSIIKSTHKKAIIVAPTGIAAINAGGVTIHSQFQLPFGTFVPSSSFQVNDYLNFKVNNPDSLLRHLQMGSAKRQLIRSIELLIIDEVSMLRADLLDAINVVLKSIRRNNIPFGGVQVLFIGDLLQLPPVIKEEEWQLLRNYYKSAFFFDALALANNKPLYVELDKIYRQSDPNFIHLLNHFRDNEVDWDDIELLNTHYRPNFTPDPSENYITLTTHNKKADAINKLALEAIIKPVFGFEASIVGEFSEYAYPVEFRLELKIGAQVMFIKNDPSGEQRFFNGKLAIVSKLEKDQIVVLLDGTQEEISVAKYEWKNIRFELNPSTNEVEEKEVGKYIQYPIRLAWAITIHKSQGLTFERAILDINDAFAPGQVYVALSRLKSLDGLVLTSPPNKFNLSQNDAIVSFANLKREQGDLDMIIDEETILFARLYLVKSFHFQSLMYAVNTHVETYDKNENQSEKQKYQAWAKQLKDDTIAAKANADKFINQIEKIFAAKEEGYMTILEQRIQAAVNYFSPILKKLSQRITEQLSRAKEDKKVKAYLKELAMLELEFFKQMESINKSLVMITSINNGGEFTKEAVSQAFDKGDRKDVEEFTKSGGKEHTGKKNELPKPDTKKITFELYQQGVSIDQIALQRQLHQATIMGHLAHFVALGTIDATVLVANDRIQQILKVAEGQDAKVLTPIKQLLDDTYTYEEIKLALAHRQYQATK